MVSEISVDDIQTILNLRDGWKYIIHSVAQPLTLDYVCKVYEYVSRNESLEWGVLRKGTVGVGKTVLKEIDRIKRILNSNCFGTETSGLPQWWRVKF